MLQEILEQRRVPAIRDFTPEEWPALREELKEILLSEEYGRPVPEPTKVSFEIAPLDYKTRNFAAGKAFQYHVTAHTVVCGKEFSFPFQAILPKKKGKYPFFIHNDFAPETPSRYTPAEEIIDNGFAVLKVCYQDVTTDDGDFTNGLAGILYPDGVRKNPDDPGKIAMWAWANKRLMDFAETREELDLNYSAVIGHSRLGKTALVTGMLDERFQFVCSNGAGCSGDAITREKEGEHIEFITNRFAYWFCENYLKYVNEELLTFDQHMLLATTAPRTLLIGAAIEDTWADPDSQYLSCFAASKVWKTLGKRGLVAPDRLPVVGAAFNEGNVCYQLREGTHYLSRKDWRFFMDTILKKKYQ